MRVSLARHALPSFLDRPAASPTGRTAFALPKRKFARLVLAVSSAAVLLVVAVHHHAASLALLRPGRFHGRIQTTLGNISLPSQAEPGPAAAVVAGDPADDAYNSTLGFEKVFYISMPHRTDRQDAMNLIASLTDIQLTLEPGVVGKDIHPKARPESSDSMRPAQLGCWRAHANIWSRMLNERISSALIMEDDADWDVKVHDSFALVGRHMRATNLLRGRNLTEYEREAAPYGLDWDLIYFGQCWDSRNKNDSTHIHFLDPHGPSRDQLRRSYQRELESYGYNLSAGARHRLLTRSWAPVCTVAYAATLRGARRLLYNLGGYEGVGAPVDLAMARLVQRGRVRAVSVVPPLVVDWKLDAKSDVNVPAEGAARKGKPIGQARGWSQGLRRSARGALGALGDVVV